MAEGESGRNRGFWGFWSSLPGVLTGLAAVIAAAAAMAQLLKDDGGSSTPEASGGSIVRPDSSSPAESQPAPEGGSKGFRVLDIQLSGPSPGDGESVRCPPKVAWQASFRVVGKGTVRYLLSEIGGTAATEGTVPFQDTTFRSVPITLTVKGSSGENAKGKVVLRIIEPRSDKSWDSEYDLLCE